MANRSDLVKLAIKTPSGVTETVWATPLGSGLYRLENSLFLGYGMSFQDVVEAVPGPYGRFPVVTQVHTRSGNRTLRAHLEDGLASDDGVKLRAAINAIGCTYEGSQSRILSINIPRTTTLDDVARILENFGAEFEYVDPEQPPHEA